MSSIELAAGVALIGGGNLLYPVTIAATAFLLLSMVFFVAISLGPYMSPSSLTEDQKNAAIGLGAAIVGAVWMVSILLAASYLS